MGGFLVFQLIYTTNEGKSQEGHTKIPYGSVPGFLPLDEQRERQNTQPIEALSNAALIRRYEL